MENSIDQQVAEIRRLQAELAEATEVYRQSRNATEAAYFHVSKVTKEFDTALSALRSLALRCDSNVPDEPEKWSGVFLPGSSSKIASVA